MILLTHILMGISTVVAASYGLFQPSRRTILATKIGSIATVASGVALAALRHVSLGHLCLSGGLLVGFSLVSIFLGNRRLAQAPARSR